VTTVGELIFSLITIIFIALICIKVVSDGWLDYEITQHNEMRDIIREMVKAEALK